MSGEGRAFNQRLKNGEGQTFVVQIQIQAWTKVTCRTLMNEFMLFVKLRLSEEVDQYVTKKKNRSVFCLSSPRVSIRRFFKDVCQDRR